MDLDDGYLGSGTVLKKAIKKYGKKSFRREVLYVFDNAEDSYAKEKDIVCDIIVSDTAFYNQTEGGKCPSMNYEIRKKISESRKGKTSGSNNPMYGKTHSPEIRAKIGRRKYLTGKDHPASRKVVCVETGEVFDTISDAKKSLNKNSNISRAIKNNTLAAGYHWRYEDK